ncbi:MAG: hypothetical protein AAFQ12_13295, partial [Pseudomonadota bacterium]
PVSLALGRSARLTWPTQRKSPKPSEPHPKRAIRFEGDRVPKRRLERLPAVHPRDPRHLSHPEQQHTDPHHSDRRADQTALAIYDGLDWSALGPASQMETLGINATADAYNRLILSANASLFDHEGTGHQLKVNKATETDTGSLVFQTGYQGHAEMGLAGNNNFNVKVSPDGQTFSNAILIRNDTGNVGIDTYWPTAKLDVGGPVRIGQVKRADLPSASETGAGAIVYVSDYPGGTALAFSDGGNWRLMHNRAVL